MISFSFWRSHFTAQQWRDINIQFLTASPSRQYKGEGGEGGREGRGVRLRIGQLHPRYVLGRCLGESEGSEIKMIVFDCLGQSSNMT